MKTNKHIKKRIAELEKKIFTIDSIEKAVMWYTLTNDRRFIKGYSDEQVKKVYEKFNKKGESNGTKFR